MGCVWDIPQALRRVSELLKKGVGLELGAPLGLPQIERLAFVAGRDFDLVLTYHSMASVTLSCWRMEDKDLCTTE